MPTYRVYYAERDTSGRQPIPYYESREARLGMNDTGSYSETEWEEEVEGRDTVAALGVFFKEHVRDNSDLMWLDEGGKSLPVEGLSYDAERTYIWIEDGKMMEYQGIDEATAGMVSCPLCEGHGEITVEQADEYLSALGEQIDEGDEEGVTWG